MVGDGADPGRAPSRQRPGPSPYILVVRNRTSTSAATPRMQDVVHCGFAAGRRAGGNVFVSDGGCLRRGSSPLRNGCDREGEGERTRPADLDDLTAKPPARSLTAKIEDGQARRSTLVAAAGSGHGYRPGRRRLTSKENTCPGLLETRGAIAGPRAPMPSMHEHDACRPRK